jgi:uncharacterized protein
MNQKRTITILLAVMLVMLILPGACAISMKLLAVSKSGTGLIGTDADLELEVKPGSGRVFISTFPLTNVDTQVSFRMAQEYACDFLNRDCSGYDFFYVIKSSAPIIGGPSAGAPATALTIIALDNLKLDKTVAATGTINSGGIIGPVAGIKQKIEAAGKAGMKKVLIPEGTRYATADELPLSDQLKLNFSNITLDLVEYGQLRGIQVIEVADINDMVYELTGKRYPGLDGNVEISPMYSVIMENISQDLCERSQELLNSLSARIKAENSEELDSARNLTRQAALSYQNKFYYSAASYCYGANVKYRYLSLLGSNLTIKQLSMLINSTDVDRTGLAIQLENYKYNTINDLQTYLVVSERLTEASSYLNDAKGELNSSSLDDSVYSASLAIERVYSAYYWSKFFGQGGREFDIKPETLSRFCLDKISEADERIQYIRSIVPVSMGLLQTDLDSATLDYGNGKFEECIFKASKVIARTNLVMNAIGLQEKDFGRVIDYKIEKARQAIIKETKRQVFPILGYSYYEYAQNLKNTDQSSAMLYAELSLELSNFDMYLEPIGSKRLAIVDIPPYMYFLGGMTAGYIIAILLVWTIKLANARKAKKAGLVVLNAQMMKSRKTPVQRRK